VYFSGNSAAPAGGQARVILCTLAEKVPFADTPQALKAGGDRPRKGDKKQMQEVMRMLLGLAEPPSPDHAADALAAAFCHASVSAFRRLAAQAHV
jgi:crossover junction endodeoxyribonuclease RuvC